MTVICDDDDVDVGMRNGEKAVLNLKNNFGLLQCTELEFYTAHKQEEVYCLVL